jgi:hypothetical protein
MNKLGRWMMNILISVDQLGNSLLAGDPDETISSRLGRIKAKYNGRIPWTRPISKATEYLLGKIQKNHCEISIEPDEGDKGIFDNPNKILRVLLVLLVPCCLFSGCATGPALDINKMAEMYYTQQKTAEMITLRWSGKGRFTIEAENLEFSMAAPVAPLSIIPQNPSTAQAVLSTAKDVLLMGAGIWTMHDLGMALARRPQVVDQQIVRPEIITVPAQ